MGGMSPASAFWYDDPTYADRPGNVHHDKWLANQAKQAPASAPTPSRFIGLYGSRIDPRATPRKDSDLDVLVFGYDVGDARLIVAGWVATHRPEWAGVALDIHEGSCAPCVPAAPYKGIVIAGMDRDFMVPAQRSLAVALLEWARGLGPRPDSAPFGGPNSDYAVLRALRAARAAGMDLNDLGRS